MIRAAEPGDAPQLEALYRNFLLAMCAYDPAAMELNAAARLAASLRRSDTTLFVCAGQASLTGFVRVQQKQRPGAGGRPYPYAKLTDLYVVPEARRAGAGSALLRQALRWAAARDLPEAVLKVDAANTAAHRLYRTMGFADDAALGRGRIRMVRRTDALP